MPGPALGSLQTGPCSLVSNVDPISWERRWDLREWAGASQDRKAEGVGVERPDGQEDNQSGAWECCIGCTQKTWDRRALNSGKFGFYFVGS